MFIIKMRKIFALICRISESKQEFLLLHNNPVDPKEGGDIWYTVTGAVEGEESLENAVKREIDEETGIQDIKEIEFLDTVFKYKMEDIDCEEYAFLVLANDDVKHLSEESIDYKWVDQEGLREQMFWYGDRVVLNGFVKKAEEMFN